MSPASCSMEDDASKRSSHLRAASPSRQDNELSFFESLWKKKSATATPETDDSTPPITPESSPTYERSTLPRTRLCKHEEFISGSSGIHGDSNAERSSSAVFTEALPLQKGNFHTRAVSLPDTRSIQSAAAAVAAETLQVHSTSAISKKLRSRRRSTAQPGKGILLTKKRRRRRKSSVNIASDDEQSITSSSDLSSLTPPRVIKNRQWPMARRRKSKTEMRWYHYFLRFGNSNGLIWLMCFIAGVSVTSTIVANRSLNHQWKKSQTNGPTMVLYKGNVPLRTAHLPPRAGLRGFNSRRVSDSKHAKKKKPKTSKHHDDKERIEPIQRLTEDARHAINAPDSHHAMMKKRKSETKDTGASEVDKNATPKKPDAHKKAAEKEQHKPDKKSKSKDKKPPKKKIGMFSLISDKVSTQVFDVPELLRPKVISQKTTQSSHVSGVALPSIPLEGTKPEYELNDPQMYGRSTKGTQRVSYVDPSFSGVPLRHRTLDLYPSDYTDPTQLYPILDSGDERLSLMEPREPYVQGECVPMQKWQTTYHPSCNGVHELSINGILGSEKKNEDMNLFGTKGFWRNAWRVELPGGYGTDAAPHDKFVLKTLKLEHNFEEAHFEHDRIDAVAMERLTASPHVIDAYGFCGHTVMTEFADGKRLGELADRAKKQPLERLRIARDIAQGLADVHGIDGDGNVTFVHLDINPANVVSINGRLKLNDFNIGIPRKWNTTSNKPCGFPTQYPNPQWRSPEEARNVPDLTEKVDIYSLGHIFFRLICGHEPWNKFEPVRPTKEELTDKVSRGIMPTIPVEVQSSKDPEVICILRVMLRCYALKPEDRPSAREIFVALDTALRRAEKATLVTT